MKTVLITGSNSGIGREAVPLFLKARWRVIATMRKLSERQTEFNKLTDKFGDALCLDELDVTLAADRQRISQKIESLDCLINNAGFALYGALEDISEAQLRRQMEANFFGAALLTQELLPTLRKSRGRILNVSSIFGTTGFPLTSAYCASKFALEGLSESLRYELAPHGVSVGLVEPGGHRTKLTDSAEWAVNACEPYHNQNNAYRSLQTKLTSTPKGTPAKNVARVLVHLAKARRLPLRTYVGHDATGMKWTKRLIPERIHTPLLQTLLSRLLPHKGTAL